MLANIVKIIKMILQQKYYKRTLLVTENLFK